MRILGFDPGLATVGFGVLDFVDGAYNLIDVGCIRTPAHDSLGHRLCLIRDDAEKLIRQHNPDHVCLEELFFVKNISTGIKVAHARGVLLEVVERMGMSYSSVTPLQVKQAVTGYGQATKMQVQKMVQSILGLDTHIASDDAADALAVAICGSHSHVSVIR